MSSGWTVAEENGLADVLAGGRRRPACPRCGERLERRNVRPRDDVAYVRDRILLVCGGCGARGAIDRRKVERRRSRPEGHDADPDGRGEGGPAAPDAEAGSASPDDEAGSAPPDGENDPAPPADDEGGRGGGG